MKFNQFSFTLTDVPLTPFTFCEMLCWIVKRNPNHKYKKNSAKQTVGKQETKNLQITLPTVELIPLTQNAEKTDWSENSTINNNSRPIQIHKRPSNHDSNSSTIPNEPLHNLLNWTSCYSQTDIQTSDPQQDQHLSILIIVTSHQTSKSEHIDATFQIQLILLRSPIHSRTTEELILMDMMKLHHDN